MDPQLPPRLVGVGVGPGDPELVTLKAARVLAEADVILVPQTDAASEGRAETIVRAVHPDAVARIVRLPFSMALGGRRSTARTDAWASAGDAVAQAFAGGASLVVFATIGDPSVYSTFSYLAGAVRERVPEVVVEVVPGVTAMQALAAASGRPLVEGDEILALVPLKGGIDALVNVAPEVDSIVVYKPGRHFAELADYLASMEADAIVGIDVGLPSELIAPVAALDEAPYFATVLWTPERDEIGGRL